MGFHPKFCLLKSKNTSSITSIFLKFRDVIDDKIDRPFAPVRKWTLDKDLFFFICGFNEVQYIFKLKFVYCSDFYNESNGILVLGVVSFQTNFDFLTSYF